MLVPVAYISFSEHIRNNYIYIIYKLIDIEIKACLRGSYFFVLRNGGVDTFGSSPRGSLSNRPLCLQLAFGHAWSLGSSAASLISGSSLALSLL